MFKTYVSHKVVLAQQIARVAVDASNNTPAHFVLTDGSEFFPTEVAMLKRATAGDYAMIYADGYKSVCPRKQFEDGYALEELSADASDTKGLSSKTASKELTPETAAPVAQAGEDDSPSAEASPVATYKGKRHK